MKLYERGKKYTFMSIYFEKNGVPLTYKLSNA